ncbi:MAG: DNA-processing protein DprA [bacterium]|nr:DNA-processing protein DprA [bacterium]
MDLKSERDYWLVFSTFPKIGPRKFKVLRDCFGSAEKAWSANKEKFLEIGFSEKLFEEFERHRQSFDFSSYSLRLKRLKVNSILLEDNIYPENLKRIADPPFLLYSIGEILPGDSLAIGVVGTRKITSYGKEVTENLVGNLVNSELTIVSGLAYGVDFVAHNSALDNNGRTIGVWAGGLDTVESGFRQNLVKQIVDEKRGAVVSEFPLGFQPNRTTFPQRNRIISGLSLGVLVTEAAEDSGSLITANFAKKQGRPVFAVPGPITSGQTKGTAELLKKGAKLVYDVNDILSELELGVKGQGIAAREVLPDNEEEALVLKILKNESKHIDEIVRETKMETSKIASLLTIMEMKGKIKNLGGMVYTLSS